MASIGLACLLHLCPFLPHILALWRGESVEARLRVFSTWREHLAAQAEGRHRVLLGEFVLLGPSRPLRMATTQPQERTERVRAIQRAIYGAWNSVPASVPGRAVVSLRIGETGHIHEYSVQGMAGGEPFERFLLDFVRALVRGPAVADPGAPLWVECEFVVEPSP